MALDRKLFDDGFQASLIFGETFDPFNQLIDRHLKRSFPSIAEFFRLLDPLRAGLEIVLRSFL